MESEEVTLGWEQIRQAIVASLLDYFSPGVTETVLSETEARLLAGDVILRLRDQDQLSG